jgi:hypothetical protein
MSSSRVRWHIGCNQLSEHPKRSPTMAQQYGSGSGPYDGSGKGGAGQRDPALQQRTGSDDELGKKAREVGEQAKVQARGALNQQTRTAADKLDHIADSVKAAAASLEQDDDTGLSQYVSGMAGSLGELAEGLRSKNVDELVRDVRQMAQRNPALFVTGSVAIGFGLARFARASSQRPHATGTASASTGASSAGAYRGNYGATDSGIGNPAAGTYRTDPSSAPGSDAEPRSTTRPYTSGSSPHTTGGGKLS